MAENLLPEKCPNCGTNIANFKQHCEPASIGQLKQDCPAGWLKCPNLRCNLVIEIKTGNWNVMGKDGKWIAGGPNRS